jgi:hypothetical protein
MDVYLAAKNISKKGPLNCRSPFDFAQGRLSALLNFLLNLVALANFMRLSLRKGAQRVVGDLICKLRAALRQDAALSSAAWQEIRLRSR